MVWIGVLWDLTTSSIARFVYHTSAAAASPNYAIADSAGYLRHLPSAEHAMLWSVHPAMLVGTFTTLAAAILRIWLVFRILAPLTQTCIHRSVLQRVVPAKTIPCFFSYSPFPFRRCFKTLGPLFTFEVTIRPQHELITHGPYAIVRHPSYIGIYLTLLGASAVLCAPGTWLASGGWMTGGGFLMVSVWSVKCLFVFRGTCLRLKAEDDILRATFGAKWEEYARKVPYRMIPFVF